MMLMMMLIMGMNGNVGAMIAYDCNKPQMSNTYSLVDTTDCPEANPHRVIEVKDEKYYLYQETEYYRTQVKE